MCKQKVLAIKWIGKIDGRKVNWNKKKCELRNATEKKCGETMKIEGRQKIDENEMQTKSNT